MKKQVLTIAGAMLAAIVLMTITPKAAQAVAAALVQVTNTAANPVPVSNVDDAARIPYQSSSTGSSCTGGVSCEIDFPAVPNNKRLVITHFDSLVYVVGGNLSLTSISSINNTNRSWPEFSFTSSYSGLNIYQSSRAVEYYVEAGNYPFVDFQATAGNVSPTSVTLTGYLIDCTTNCAAIAH